MLFGRDSELVLLRERITQLAAGGDFALLVEGDPGIGKTALVESGLAATESVRVLPARGYEAERDIPYAGLFELARPLLGLRDRLPGAQRRALERAFALQEVPTPHDRFAVPAALHSLLRLAGGEQPTLVVVDDLHWFDPASREALGFAARRLGGEARGLAGTDDRGSGGGSSSDGGLSSGGGLGLLMTTRPAELSPGEFAGIETLVLTGLDDAHSRRVLAAHHGELAPGLAAELIRTARGNPLALRELPASLSAQELAGQRPIAEPLPLSAAIERAFSRRIKQLSPQGRQAVSLLAAMGQGRIAVFLAAGESLGLDLDALAEAERAEIVSAHRAADRLAFRHPLLRSAAYQAATEAERRRNHTVLAEVVEDPSRRAWHLARAAAGRDEEVASALEAAGRDARARSGHSEAAHAFARAAELSTVEADRGRRHLAAAQDFAIAGRFDLALAQLDLAEPLIEPHLGKAAARIRGHLALRQGELTLAQRTLEEAAERAFAQGDHASAATLFLESSISYSFTGDSAGMAAVLARARRSTEVIGGVGATVVRVMDVVSALVDGRPERAATELAAIEPELGELDLVPSSDAIGLMASALAWAGQLEAACRVSDLLVDRLREASAYGALPYPLSVRALCRERVGDWRSALADAREADRLGEEVGHETLRAYCLAVLSRVESGLGEIDEALNHAELGLEIARRGDALTGQIYNLAAIGRAALAGNDAKRAAESLDRAAELIEGLGWAEPGMAMEAGDRAEALMRSSRRDEAAAVRDRLLAQSGREGTNPWGRAVAERIGLLLAEDEAAIDAHAEAALSWHERDGMPFERARTELAWGERLRRLRKRRRAREPLARALATFRELGALPWQARAHSELEAAGGSAGADAVGGAGGAVRAEPSGPALERDPATALASLTPHERKVAALVAQGMTNREVASALFLSPKTIERHLSQIYRSLDLRSRTELARLVSGVGVTEEER